jgi:hypothetical protein
MCWDKADITAMKMVMDQINWERAFNGKDAEQCWLFFSETVKKYTEEYVPKRTIKILAKQKWVTREIIKLIRMKKRRWREYKLY